MYRIQNRLINFLQSEVVTSAHIGQQAAVLTLATLFTLVPMISGLVWIVSHIPTYQVQLFEQFEVFLSYLIPDQALVWRERMSSWTDQVNSLQTFSLFLLFASTIFLVNRVDHALHWVFQVESGRGGKRWLHYLWVMPVLMGILVLSMTLIVVAQILLGTGLAVLLPGINLTSIPAMLVILCAVYQLSSRNTVSFKTNILVSLTVTILLHFLQMAFAWVYLNLPNWSIVFGVFSAFPLFLLWCQMAWSLLLYGALFLRWMTPRRQEKRFK